MAAQRPPTPLAAYLAQARTNTYWTLTGGAQVVLPNTANGPTEIGLAASGSEIVSADARLNIYPSLVQTIARLPVPAGPSPDLQGCSSRCGQASPLDVGRRNRRGR